MTVFVVDLTNQTLYHARHNFQTSRKDTPLDIHKMKMMKEVAAEMNLTRRHIHTLCKKADVTGVKVGPSIMFSPSEVQKIKRVKRRKYEKNV